jgi:hypothetical protein
MWCVGDRRVWGSSFSRGLALFLVAVVGHVGALAVQRYVVPIGDVKTLF